MSVIDLIFNHGQESADILMAKPLRKENEQ
jgi:hypothetical protein